MLLYKFHHDYEGNSFYYIYVQIISILRWRVIGESEMEVYIRRLRAALRWSIPPYPPPLRARIFTFYSKRR